MHKSKSALIVFAKVPEPGKVKTRLTSLLSPEWAARLYESFLLDALDLYSSLKVDVRLYFSSPVDRIPERFRLESLSLHQQKGPGLGERMATAFVETFIAGYERAIVIGTDHPTLPVSFIEQAFELLKDPHSVVIGPSDDGGYYLLGMSEFYSVLFKDMVYSHEQVFSQTMQRAANTDAFIHVMPAWYDVDTPDALKRLIGELSQSSLPLKRTKESIERLGVDYPSLIE